MKRLLFMFLILLRAALPAGEPEDLVVFTGSSSIRLWAERLPVDMAPLNVLPRGFGGSTYAQLLAQLDARVLQHRPRAVVIYSGENDLARGGDPAEVLATARQIAERIHAELPGIPIHFIGVKPSPRRAEAFPAFGELNRSLEALCAGDPRLSYVDVWSRMLDAGGNPDPRYFVEDGVHLSEAGYDLWTRILRAALMPGGEQP